jgi:ankyrin repeat protein
VKILLERVGNTNIQTDHQGKTALHYAAENSELSVS